MARQNPQGYNANLDAPGGGMERGLYRAARFPALRMASEWRADSAVLETGGGAQKWPLLAGFEG